MSIMQSIVATGTGALPPRGNVVATGLAALSMGIFGYSSFLAFGSGYSRGLCVAIGVGLLVDAVARAQLDRDRTAPSAFLLVDTTARTRLSILISLPYLSGGADIGNLSSVLLLLFIMSVHFDAMVPRMTAKVRGAYGKSAVDTGQPHRRRRLIPIGFLEIGLVGGVLGPWVGYPLAGFGIAILLAALALAGHVAATCTTIEVGAAP